MESGDHVSQLESDVWTPSYDPEYSVNDSSGISNDSSSWQWVDDKLHVPLQANSSNSTNSNTTWVLSPQIDVAFDSMITDDASTNSAATHHDDGISSSEMKLVLNTTRRLSHLAEIYPISSGIRRTNFGSGKYDAVKDNDISKTPEIGDNDSVVSTSPLLPKLKLSQRRTDSSSIVSPLHRNRNLATSSFEYSSDVDDHNHATAQTVKDSRHTGGGRNNAVQSTVEKNLTTPNTRKYSSPFVSSFRSVLLCPLIYAIILHLT